MCVKTRAVRGMTTEEVRILIKKAQDIYVYSNITRAEGSWFRVTKKEVTSFLDKNGWWLEMDTIKATFDTRKNRLWIGE